LESQQPEVAILAGSSGTYRTTGDSTGQLILVIVAVLLHIVYCVPIVQSICMQQRCRAIEISIITYGRPVETQILLTRPGTWDKVPIQVFLATGRVQLQSSVSAVCLCSYFATFSMCRKRPKSPVIQGRFAESDKGEGTATPDAQSTLGRIIPAHPYGR
jgi:hypothetical protein